MITNVSTYCYHSIHKIHGGITQKQMTSLRTHSDHTKFRKSSSKCHSALPSTDDALIEDQYLRRNLHLGVDQISC